MLTLKLEWANAIEVERFKKNPVVSVDLAGNVLSRVDDDNWLFSISRSRPSSRMTVPWPADARDAKQLAFTRLTHGKVLAGRSAAVMSRELAELVAYCRVRAVSLRNVHRQPSVIIDFCSQLAKGCDKPRSGRIAQIISIARVALAAKDTLGWTFLQADQIEALARIETLASKQYPVIPRRIFQAVDDVAQAILSGYIAVADDLDEVLAAWVHAHRRQRNSGGKSEMAALLKVRPGLQRQIQSFGEGGSSPVVSYYAVVRVAAFWAIAAGSCARKSEILDLRRGCLRREQVGENLAFLLTSSTTKTQDNESAVWVACPKVELAVQALDRLLQSYIAVHPSPPQLSEGLFQILENNFGRRLSPSHARKGKRHIGEATSGIQLKKLFRHADLRITKDDWAEAKCLTPDLDEAKFEVGKQWPLSAHQIRRTVLVRAASSGLVSPDSLSFQAKHQTWQMTAYYCRNYWHLAATRPDHPLVARTRVSDAVEFARIYADSYNRARVQVMDDNRFFSPYGDKHKRAVIGETPLLSVNEIRRHRRTGVLKGTTLGLCAQDGYCEWQKAITVRGCMTKTGGNPCGKLVIDTENLSELIALGDSVRYELEELSGRDTFAREQKEADLAAVREAIDLIEQSRSSHVAGE